MLAGVAVLLSVSLIVGVFALAFCVTNTLPAASTLVPEILPDTLRDEGANAPAVSVPETERLPVTAAPVVAITSTLLTPPIVTAALPLGTGILIEVVPEFKLSPEMLPLRVVLPNTSRSPLIKMLELLLNETTLLAVKPSKLRLPVYRLTVDI